MSVPPFAFVIDAWALLLTPALVGTIGLWETRGERAPEARARCAMLWTAATCLVALAQAVIHGHRLQSDLWSLCGAGPELLATAWTGASMVQLGLLVSAALPVAALAALIAPGRPRDDT